MLKFNFTNYTDKRLKAKYAILLSFLWIIIAIQYFLSMNMFYLVWIAVLVTISAYTLYTQRIKTGFKNKCKAFSIDDDSITFTYWGKKPDQTFKLSQLEKIYLIEIPRRGKKLDPFHFFLTFEFKKKDIISSTELPTPHILDFTEDFETFIRDNNLNLNIQNKEHIDELLGQNLIELLQSLRKKPAPVSG